MVLVDSLLNFINVTLLDLDCEDLNASLNNSIDSFETILIDIKEFINTTLTGTPEIDASIKEQLENMKEAIENLINMVSSFTIANIADECLLTDIILILLNTSLSLVKILELLNVTIKYQDKCETLGENISSCVTKYLVIDVCAFQQLLCDWRNLLLCWIKKVSDINN